MQASPDATRRSSALTTLFSAFNFVRPRGNLAANSPQRPPQPAQHLPTAVSASVPSALASPGQTVPPALPLCSSDQPHEHTGTSVDLLLPGTDRKCSPSNHPPAAPPADAMAELVQVKAEPMAEDPPPAAPLAPQTCGAGCAPVVAAAAPPLPPTFFLPRSNTVAPSHRDVTVPAPSDTPSSVGDDADPDDSSEAYSIESLYTDSDVEDGDDAAGASAPDTAAAAAFAPNATGQGPGATASESQAPAENTDAGVMATVPPPPPPPQAPGDSAAQPQPQPPPQQQQQPAPKQRGRQRRSTIATTGLQFARNLSAPMIRRGELRLRLKNLPSWQLMLAGLVPAARSQAQVALWTAAGEEVDGAFLLRSVSARGPDAAPVWRLGGLGSWMQRERLRVGDKVVLRAGADGRLSLEARRLEAPPADADAEEEGEGRGDEAAAEEEGAAGCGDEESEGEGGSEGAREGAGAAAEALRSARPARRRRRAPSIEEAETVAANGLFLDVDDKTFSRCRLRLTRNAVRCLFLGLCKKEPELNLDYRVRLVDESDGEVFEGLIRAYGKTVNTTWVLKRAKPLLKKHGVQPGQRLRLRTVKQKEGDGEAETQDGGKPPILLVWVEPAAAAVAGVPAAAAGGRDVAVAAAGGVCAAADAAPVCGSVREQGPGAGDAMQVDWEAGADGGGDRPAKRLRAGVTNDDSVLAGAGVGAGVGVAGGGAEGGFGAMALVPTGGGAGMDPPPLHSSLNQQQLQPYPPRQVQATEPHRQQQPLAKACSPAGPAPSLAHLHGCVPPSAGAGGDDGSAGGCVRLPPLRPGELRLCGLTFHPDLAPAVRRRMAEWLGALGDRLGNVDPGEGQISVAFPPACTTAPPPPWQAAFQQAGLREAVICGRLARLLGLLSADRDWDADLPEDGWALVEGVAPVGDVRRGGAGLAATVPLRRSSVIGVVGGYVMPPAAAAAFAGRGFRDVDRHVTAELARRAPAAETTVAWQFVAGCFRMPYTGLELIPEDSTGPVPLELNMLGYGNMTALVNDPRVEPRGWVPGNDVDSPPAPNCMVIPVSVRGLVLPVLVALRDIAAGEQLLRDYGSDWWHRIARTWENLDFDGVTAEQLLHPAVPPAAPAELKQEPAAAEWTPEAQPDAAAVAAAAAATAATGDEGVAAPQPPLGGAPTRQGGGDGGGGGASGSCGSGDLCSTVCAEEGGDPRDASRQNPGREVCTGNGEDDSGGGGGGSGGGHEAEPEPVGGSRQHSGCTEQGGAAGETTAGVSGAGGRGQGRPPPAGGRRGGRGRGSGDVGAAVAADVAWKGRRSEPGPGAAAGLRRGTGRQGKRLRSPI